MYLQVTRMSCGLGCAAHVWPHRKPRRMQVLEARVLLSFPSGGSGIVPQSVQIVEEFRISVNSLDILPRASARSFIHSFIRSVPLPSSLSHGASHADLRKTRFNAEVLTSSWDGNWRGRGGGGEGGRQNQSRATGSGRGPGGPTGRGTARGPPGPLSRFSRLPGVLGGVDEDPPGPGRVHVIGATAFVPHAPFRRDTPAARPRQLVSRRTPMTVTGILT